MADKFLRHGEAFCGDGTTNAVAASAGAVGAWNNINVFEGTAPAFGALAAGDVVYVRSKDNAGADISRTIAAATSLGSTSGTASSPITWILDNGAIWPGIDGTLTYTNAAALGVTTLVYNRIEAETRGALIVKNTAANPATHSMVTNNAHTVGMRIDCVAKTGTTQLYAAIAQGIYEDCIFALGRLGTGTAPFVTYPASAVTAFQLLNCEWILSNATPGVQPLVGPNSASYISNIDMIGCRVSGGVGYSGQVFCGSNGGNGSRSRMIGCDIPKSMTICGTHNSPYNEIEAIGCDGGIGTHIESSWGYATSRSDNNPPTLSASLPDSASTPWSYRVYPRNPTQQAPMRLPIAKLFAGDPAVKTLTLEMLVADTLTPTKDKVWGVLIYTDDATGALKSISSRDFGTLVSSSAGWTFDAWGTVNFQKYKIALTTPTAVKKDTLIIFTLFGTMLSATADDILFVDPDFGIV